jgi:hypothetical protein
MDDLSGMTRVGTWREAARLCDDDETLSMLVESMNLVADKVQDVDYNLHNLRNIFAAYSMPRLPELAEKYIKPRVPAEIDPKVIINQINWITERCINPRRIT